MAPLSTRVKAAINIIVKKPNEMPINIAIIIFLKDAEDLFNTFEIFSAAKK